MEITDKDYRLPEENNKMGDEIKEAGYHPADTNGDGRVSTEEEQMYLEFKRKELEDQDAMRDAQRTGRYDVVMVTEMLNLASSRDTGRYATRYPATVMVTEMLNLHQVQSRDTWINGIRVLRVSCRYRCMPSSEHRRGLVRTYLL